MNMEPDEQRKKKLPLLLFLGAAQSAPGSSTIAAEPNLEAFPFTNAAKAMRWAKKNPPAAALIDFDTAGPDGLAFARALQEKGFKNPIFVVGSRVELIAKLALELRRPLAGIYEKPLDAAAVGRHIYAQVTDRETLPLRAPADELGNSRLPSRFPRPRAALNLLNGKNARRAALAALLAAAFVTAGLVFAGNKTAPTRTASANAAISGSGTAAQELDGALGNSTDGLSLVVMDAKGHVLYSRGADEPLAPASTLKLLVAAAAFATMGPNFRFKTTTGSEYPPRAGILPGNLIVKGEGDPSLASADLDAAVAELRNLGVRRIEGGIDVVRAPFTPPEQNPNWAKTDLTASYAAGSAAVSLDGNLEHGVPMRNIPRAVGTVLRQKLENAGVQVAQGVREVAQGGPTWVAWEHRSAPLAVLVREMLSESNNHSAEQLLRSLGLHSGGAATPESGIRAERALLERWHVDIVGLDVFDGSGLAEPNRATARTLAELLSRVQHSETGTLLYESLPLLGAEGTTAGRVLHAAQGRVRAKDGHLHNANALAGYLDTSHHGRLAFAFIANGVNLSNARFENAENRIVDILATL